MRRPAKASFVVFVSLFFFGCPAVVTPDAEVLAEWQMVNSTGGMSLVLGVTFYSDGEVLVDVITDVESGRWTSLGNNEFIFTYGEGFFQSVVEFTVSGGSTLDTATSWQGTISNVFGGAQSEGFRVYP